MPKEREIIRIAASLIREYGDQANLEAVRRMNAVVETGDLEAQPDSVKRPVVARGSGVDGFWLPVPRQEVVDAVDGMAVDHALEHVSEVCVGLDPVELCRGDEG